MNDKNGRQSAYERVLAKTSIKKPLSPLPSSCAVDDTRPDNNPPRPTERAAILQWRLGWLPSAFETTGHVLNEGQMVLAAYWIGATLKPTDEEVVRRCKQCGDLLPIDQFPRKPSGRNNRADICNCCQGKGSY